MKQKPASVSHRRDESRKDERIRRTCARIDAAFVDLLHRRPYGHIRISQLCKKASVGRATFYAHYATKDALLLSQFQRIVAPMLTAQAGDPPGVNATAFFAHVCSAPRIYRGLMGPDGGSSPRVLMHSFEKRLREIVRIENETTLEGLALSRVLASSLIAIVECSLERGATERPAEMQKLFHELSAPMIARLGQFRASK